MRIDPKYFNKFMIVLGVVCILAIVYFNFYYQHRQFQGIEERIGDGTVLLEASFSKLFDDDEITLNDIPQRKMIIFWATWSERAGELARMIDEFQISDRVFILSAAVRDTPEMVRESGIDSMNSIIHVNGTPLYQDLKIPGIPSVFVFDEQNTLIYSRIGFRESRDRDDLYSALTQSVP